MGRMIDSSTASPPLAVVSSPVRQNVTFAVNYSLPEIGQFVKTYRIPTPCVTPSTPNSRSQVQTNFENNPAWINRGAPEKMTGPPLGEKDNIMAKISFKAGPTDISAGGEVKQRRTRRETKPKVIAREKNRVKYDMNVVPGARRNREFVNQYGAAWHTGREEREIQREGAQPAAFTDNASVVWIPTKRAEWEDCVSEMTAVCTSAALRRRAVEGGLHKPFYAPLSKDYIRDRVDIDDPLEGYQIRHKGGGWLQGFILWTNFTTWTHYFKWDSLHAQSGIPGTDNKFRVDSTGNISAELESQPRSGDPLGGGVVHSTIAEISLLGGIGCGEYLLRMALDDIMSRGSYKYVVLQATDTSRAFYERFGFVRVGAVSVYGSKDVVAQSNKEVDSNKRVSSSNEITGYRHWTYAHESSHSLDMHGGPSYMMALPLPSREDIGTQQRTFFEAMKELSVSEKPKIMQLGGASTPALKKKKLVSVSGIMPPLPNPYLKHVSTPGKNRRKRLLQSNEKNLDKTAIPSNDLEPVHTNKRRKPSPSSNLSVVDEKQREILMTPPPPGKSLTYAQKQYQSVWLAVPPSTSESSSGRKPPRRRDSFPEPKSTVTPKVVPKKKETKVALSRSESIVTPKVAPKKKETKVALSRSVTPRKPTRTTTRVPSDAKTSVPKNNQVTPIQYSSRDKTLRKQKVLSVPRNPNAIYFYNKVVTPKDRNRDEYFFVLNYDEGKSVIRIIPLVRQGELVGKRQGRPRYKAVLANHANAPTVPISDYDIVSAYMVTKTPLVANETWDILE